MSDEQPEGLRCRECGEDLFEGCHYCEHGIPTCGNCGREFVLARRPPPGDAAGVRDDGRTDEHLARERALVAALAATPSVDLAGAIDLLNAHDAGDSCGFGAGPCPRKPPCWEHRRAEARATPSVDQRVVSELDEAMLEACRQVAQHRAACYIEVCQLLGLINHAEGQAGYELAPREKVMQVVRDLMTIRDEEDAEAEERAASPAQRPAPEQGERPVREVVREAMEPLFSAACNPNRPFPTVTQIHDAMVAMLEADRKARP